MNKSRFASQMRLGSFRSPNSMASLGNASTHRGNTPVLKPVSTECTFLCKLLLLVPVNHIIRAGIPYGGNTHYMGNTYEDIGNKAGEMYQRIEVKVRESEKQEGIGKTRGLKIVIIF